MRGQAAAFEDRGGGVGAAAGDGEDPEEAGGAGEERSGGGHGEPGAEAVVQHVAADGALAEVEQADDETGTGRPALGDSSLTDGDLATLGQDVMKILIHALRDCVTRGYATSTDLFADTVALWLGLHGLAHQRAVTRAFPWPNDIANRLITALAHLSDA